NLGISRIPRYPSVERKTVSAFSILKSFSIKILQKMLVSKEMIFHEYESACEQSRVCGSLKGLERTHCVRECISPSCYREIYQLDPLEEGEIDVRLNSFKGCFIQRSGRTRN
ncbi:unnamed protein product, partial [Leptidea sinapis]